MAGDAARAVQAARAAPGGIATLILPAETAWNEAERAAQPLADIAPAPASADAIEEVAKLLVKNTALLMRGSALYGKGLEEAGRIQAKTGARLFCDTFAPHAELGAGRVPVERIPYFAEQIVAFLADIEQIILVGAKPPVSFFAYPGKPSWCAPDACKFFYLAQVHEDAAAALSILADELGAPVQVALRVPPHLPEMPTGPLTALSAAQSLGRSRRRARMRSERPSACSTWRASANLSPGSSPRGLSSRSSSEARARLRRCAPIWISEPRSFLRRDDCGAPRLSRSE